MLRCSETVSCDRPTEFERTLMRAQRYEGLKIARKPVGSESALRGLQRRLQAKQEYAVCPPRNGG